MAGGTIIHADATNGDDEGSLYSPIVGRNWKGTNGAPTPSPTELPVSRQRPLGPSQTGQSSGIASIGFATFHVVGEVKKSILGKADFVRVTVNLFNQQTRLSTPISATHGLTFCRLVNVRASKFCFWAVLITLTTRLKRSTTTPRMKRFLLAYLVIAEHTIRCSQTGMRLLDKRAMMASVNAEYVQIVGTLYQTNGSKLGCDSMHTNADVLTPGQVSTWKMLFLYAPNGSVLRTTDYRHKLENNRAKYALIKLDFDNCTTRQNVCTPGLKAGTRSAPYGQGGINLNDVRRHSPGL